MLVLGLSEFVSGDSKMGGQANTPLGVTFGSLGVLGPKAVIDIAQTAQGLGYKSIWTVEANGTDALSLLGAVYRSEHRRSPRCLLRPCRH